MKKISMFCGIALILTLIAGTAYALSFGFDIDGDEIPGEVPDDTEVTIYESDTIEVGVYLTGYTPTTNLFGVDWYFTWHTDSLEYVSDGGNDGQWDDITSYLNSRIFTTQYKESPGIEGTTIHLLDIVLHCKASPSTDFIKASIGTDGVVVDINGNDYGDETYDSDATIHQIECLEDADCNDDSVCTVDSCNLDTNQCVFDPVLDGTNCDDGLYCNGTATCQVGVCVAGEIPCQEEDPCQGDYDYCTIDCDDLTDTCYVCNATGPSDDCCTECSACEGVDVCTIEITDYYVDGTNGNNSNSGTSPGDAWKTITHALDTIPALITLDEKNRATVHVARSTYDRNMGGGDAEDFPLIMKEYISLFSDDGYEYTIIDAGGDVYPLNNVIEFAQEEDIHNVTIDGFTITGGYNFRGAGITVIYADPVISNCKIIDNESYAINGGGIYLSRSNAIISNCIISHNTAFGQRGGGISCGNQSSPEIINCTIVDNGTGCLEDEGGGGIIIGKDGSATVINTILWGNYKDCSPEPELNQILVQENATLTIDYSCVQGGEAGVGLHPEGTLIWGDGNTDQDPNFFGTDYHLMHGSSCIDSADSGVSPVTIPIPDSDIDEYDRYDDCATPDSGVGPYSYYDRGAREYQGDSDLDGIMDDSDDEGCIIGDNPCTGGETVDCDDNCVFIPNPNQEDDESDGQGNVCDNCPETPNGQDVGACVKTLAGLVVSCRVGETKDFITCTSNDDCVEADGTCQMEQGDCNENGIGDVCECYADGYGSLGVPDGKVTIWDFIIWKEEFGRIDCNENTCQADYNEDGKVTVWDFVVFKHEFGRIDCPVST